jgi:hypothetical protein
VNYRALSVGVVTVAMTVPIRHGCSAAEMAPRPVIEMTATMPILAAGLLALGWFGAVPKADLALTEHGLRRRRIARQSIREQHPRRPARHRAD